MAVAFTVRLAGIATLGLLPLGVPDASAWRAMDGGGRVALDAAGDVVTAGIDIAKLTGTTGALVWSQPFGGSPAPDPYQRVVHAVAVASGDDVIAAGTLFDAGNGFDFTVARLADGSGAELWRQSLIGTATTGKNDSANVVAVDGAGDIVAAGRFENLGTAYDLGVVKLAGATGAELWRVEIDGAASGDDEAVAVAVDGAGDVIAAGTLSNGTDNTDFVVVKLAAANGAELWRVEIDGTGVGGTFADDRDQARALALDAAGDVVAVGRIGNAGTVGEFAVVKLAGGTGSEIWRQEIDVTDDDLASAVTVDGSGDIIAAGYISTVDGAYAQPDFAIVKLSGVTGVELWRTLINGAEFDGLDIDVARAVTTDAADDVVAAGAINERFHSLAVVKLDGSSGALRWRQDTLGGVPCCIGATQGVVLDAAGNAIAGGPPVVRLSALDGAVGPVPGTRIAVVDHTTSPSRRRLSVRSDDRSIVTSPSGSAGDPTLFGGTFRLVNPTTLESATFTLPAGGWEGLGLPVGALGYRYRGGSGSGDPCTLVQVRQNRFLVARCHDELGMPAFTLDEPSQGSLAAVLQLGTAEPQCMTFGGTVRADQGTANPGPTGRFVARRAPAAFGPCP